MCHRRVDPRCGQKTNVSASMVREENQCGRRNDNFGLSLSDRNSRRTGSQQQQLNRSGFAVLRFVDYFTDLTVGGLVASLCLGYTLNDRSRLVASGQRKHLRLMPELSSTLSAVLLHQSP